MESTTMSRRAAGESFSNWSKPGESGPWTATMLRCESSAGLLASRTLAETTPMTALHFSQGDEPGFGHAHSPLYNVVYCSRATADVDEAAVQHILASARRFNPEHGITGILVFGSGIFFQWLEGPRDNIQALMARLRADRRHETIVLLSEVEEVRERVFPDWDMELVSTDHIRDVLQDALDTASDPQNAEALASLLARLDSDQLSALGAS